VDDDPSREGDVRPLHVSAAIGERQRARLADARARRDADRVEAALRRLDGEARGEANLMPAILECVEAHASVGEICDRLARVFGRHEASTVV
jgi:methylmalonyl-CoA mutase N-terminal domain/subunit